MPVICYDVEISPTMQKPIYDEIAHEYYQATHKTSRNFDDTTVAAMQDVGPRVPASGLVLDIGAGRGRVNEFLGLDPKRVVQLDNSSKMLILEPREDCLLRIVHKAEELPFLEDEFSCIAAFLCDAFIGLSFLSEVYRVLSVGGLLIATLPSYEWGMTLRDMLEIDPSMTRFISDRNTTIHILSTLIPEDQIIEMFLLVGFERDKVELRRHRLPPGSSPISDDISRPAAKLGYNEHELNILYSITAEK